MQLFSASLILSRFLRCFVALTTLLHAHVCIVSDNHILLCQNVPNLFGLLCMIQSIATIQMMKMGSALSVLLKNILKNQFKGLGLF